MRIKSRKGKNYKSYKNIIYWEQLEKEIINTIYFHRRKFERIFVNQCPKCMNTNVNQDPWILHCVGNPVYIYHHHNGEDNFGLPANIWGSKKINPKFNENVEKFKNNASYYIPTGSKFHNPIEMNQEKITIEEAEKRFGHHKYK